MGTWVDWKGKRKGREKPEVFLERAGEWLARVCARVLEGDVTTVLDDDGEPTLLAPLHPAAEPLRVRASRGAGVEAWAKTSGPGPGYHRYVESILRLLSAELGVSWQGASETSRAAAEGEALSWLRASAGQCLTVLDRGAKQLALSMPTEPRFLIDSALATQLGPRDRAWLEKAAKAPEEATDVFAWWAEGVGAEERLGRALCLMWNEVAWRPPLHEGEEQTLARVAEMLSAAHAERPDLAFPYRAWHELLTLLGEKGELADRVAERARSSPEGPKVGYRRGPMLLRPFGSWEIELPGSMLATYEDDGEAFSAKEQGRAVRVSVYSVPDGSASIDELLAIGREPEARPEKKGPGAKKPAKGPGKAAKAPPLLEHEAEGARGWARVTELEGGGQMLEGHTASAGGLAVCTVAFEKASDRDWAVSIWKSLTPVG